MKKTLCLMLAAYGLLTNLNAQNGSVHFQEFRNSVRVDARSKIHVPNIPGYQTLKCDFHIHTDYSDGTVIPEERVREAWREGLDVIAITDHNWVPGFQKGGLNEVYERAAKTANSLGITLIKAVEYTSSKPVGHLNFLFVKDAEEYYGSKEPDQAVEKAAAEGAYIIYNHPGWPDMDSKLFDFQKKFIAQKKIHAMEVFNSDEFYPAVIDYCNEYGLAHLGCSDIHAPIHQFYLLDRGSRTMTLLFAKDNSEESVKEALFAGHTIACSNNVLAGKPEYLMPLFRASLEITGIKDNGGNVEFFVENISDFPYFLHHPKSFGITFPAQATVKVQLNKAMLNEPFRIENCYVESQKQLEFTFNDLLKK